MKIYSTPNLMGNGIYNPLTYSNEEIDDLFDLSEEVMLELQKVINDSKVTRNTVFSSHKTEERLKEILAEANQFAVDIFGNTNFLSIEIVTSVDEVVDNTTIYLIDDGSGNNTYNQYMLINDAVMSLGSTQCDLTNYVTNEQLEEKLEEYAKKNEVVSGSDIVTTIDDTVTNAQVPSALAVYNSINDSIKDIVDGTITIGNADKLDGLHASDFLPLTGGILTGDLSVKTNNARVIVQDITTGNSVNLESTSSGRIGIWDDKKQRWIIMEDADGEIKTSTNNNAKFFKFLHTGNISDYIGSNKAKTIIEFTNSTNWSIASTNLESFYQVKNGWCFLQLVVTCNIVANDSNSTVFTGLPIPTAQIYSTFASNDSSTDDCQLTIGVGGQLLLRGGTVGKNYSFSYTYPVAE